MMRLTLLLLCILLAAAAAGRYQAEAAVRQLRGELGRLESAKTEEFAKIQMLRAEVAYLEAPDRLAAIASDVTDLEPLSGAQLLTAEDFQIAFGGPPPRRPRDGQPIGEAMAIARLDAAREP
jgi:hypothetical protein